MARFILSIILALSFQSPCLAKEKASIEDRLIGSTFKGLAKAFVTVVDIDKLKQNNIAKIKKMDKEKFRRRYAEVYKAIKDLPLDLKAAYGINEEITKEEAIKNIESLDKKEAYKIIDAIPDRFISDQFRQYLSKKKQAIQKSNIVEQINKFWHKIIKKANTSASPPHL